MLLGAGRDHQRADAIDRVLLAGAGRGNRDGIEMGGRPGRTRDPATDQRAHQRDRRRQGEHPVGAARGGHDPLDHLAHHTGHVAGVAL
jgi:hypothetical protein